VPERFVASRPLGGSLLIGKSACIAAAMALTALALPQRAQAASGGFFVDDVEVGAVGSCKVESWVSFASNRDFIGVTSPACVVNLGRPVELTAQFLRFKADNVWGTDVQLKAKTNLIPIEPSKIGLGLFGGVTLDILTGEASNVFAVVPVSVQVTEQIRVNLNGGWVWERETGLNAAIIGAGVDWNFVKPLTLIGEVFAIAAPGQSNPRFQLGLRYTPVENIDIDLIYGRNIVGEQANWITLGLNVRWGGGDTKVAGR
jgi:hypothetical protein